MRIERLSPGILQFLSGVTAAAAVNLVTSIATYTGSRPWRLLVVACPWLAISAILFWAGSGLENARREADLLSTPSMSEDEKKELYTDSIERVRFWIKRVLIGAGLLFVIGIILPLLLF